MYNWNVEERVDEIISKLDRVAERRIQEAMKAGEFDNLPGQGRPLDLSDDNPFVPADMRVAFKALANSNYVPDWMLLAQQIEHDIAKMRYAADLHFDYLRRSLREAANPYAIKHLRARVERLKVEHKRAAAQHAEAILEINRKISTFNQTVPIASLVKVSLSFENEMAKYESRVPAYLDY